MIYGKRKHVLRKEEKMQSQNLKVKIQKAL